MKNNQVQLSESELAHILSPRAIRERAQMIFARTQKQQGHFRYHPEKLEPTIDYVVQVTKQNYPTLAIPFHSRWGHFRAGGVDRVKEVDAKLAPLDPMERARCKLDLVIPSVLLDAGAGPRWKYREGGQDITRSEGLGVASLRLFLAGVMSGDRKSPRVDAAGLAQFSGKDLKEYFQVSESNPLVGLEGRLRLVKNLGQALANREIFGSGRPGNILDCLAKRSGGKKIAAQLILQTVLEGLGPIWPGRLEARGVNLGDVWRHSALDTLVPFHKLSQWMTYSLIEPILEAGIPVDGVGDLTGLAEYRNGGLMLDSGLISLADPASARKEWAPDSDLIIEWRALTVHLLDLLGEGVRRALGLSAEEFPLAKALEGGTWWAGRFLAQEKRDGIPPLNIVSDGTVF